MPYQALFRVEPAYGLKRLVDVLSPGLIERLRGVEMLDHQIAVDPSHRLREIIERHRVYRGMGHLLVAAVVHRLDGLGDSIDKPRRAGPSSISLSLTNRCRGDYRVTTSSHFQPAYLSPVSRR
jgi:hypothetical protein